MTGRLSNSLTLVKASANVLRLDKELLVFPILSGISMILVVATFTVPFLAAGGLGWLQGETGSTYIAYVLGFLFYLVQYTVIFFFNTALVGAALIRLEGGDPTVSDGLSIALGKLPTILGYAAIAATVGMILKAISERAGFLGRIVIGLVGIAWSLATYLTVPVLVTRDVGPIDAVKESASLFRRTWGEQVVGNFGMSWAFAMMGISWGLFMVLLIIGMAQISVAAVVPAIALAVLGFLALGLVSSALSGVYTAALYRYATTGEAELFEPTMLRQAFRPKR
jgi:hypothetical protein